MQPIRHPSFKSKKLQMWKARPVHTPQCSELHFPCLLSILLTFKKGERWLLAHIKYSLVEVSLPRSHLASGEDPPPPPGVLGSVTPTHSLHCPRDTHGKLITVPHDTFFSCSYISSTVFLPSKRLKNASKSNICKSELDRKTQVLINSSCVYVNTQMQDIDQEETRRRISLISLRSRV